MSEGTHILDTVVLMYFLLAGQEGLLGKLLGWPLQVPTTVYDPDDQTSSTQTSAQPELLSEMRDVVRHYEHAAEQAEDAETSEHAAQSLRRIKRVDALHDEGCLTPVEMSASERPLAAGLVGRGAAEYGLKVPLGSGEAACVAIAYERGWTIATDDAAALQVLERLYDGQNYPYVRIRKLLRRAAEDSHVTPSEANRLHAEMRSHGFWDSGRPCPEAS